MIHIYYTSIQAFPFLLFYGKKTLFIISTDFFFHKPDERNVERGRMEGVTLRMLIARKLLSHIRLIRAVLFSFFFIVR